MLIDASMMREPASLESVLQEHTTDRLTRDGTHNPRRTPMSYSAPPRTHLSIERSTSILGASPILLSTASHLAALDRADLTRLAANTECQLLRPGHIVYRQGDRADDIFVLLEGKVMLRHRGDGDERHRDRQDFCSDGTFGDHLLVGDVARYYMAFAVSESLLLKMPWPLLTEALSCRPGIREDWTDEILLRLYRNQMPSASAQRRGLVDPRGGLSGAVQLAS